jgi:uncharacterized membrane protein YdcZ (DUF606 family)
MAAEHALHGPRLNPLRGNRLQYLTTLLISLSGAGVALQAASNAHMSAVVQSPTLSALINFAVGV